MKLIIAGGVGEHGRNCFLVEGEGSPFLVDCGTMADTPKSPYPRLIREQIGELGAVFLTHAHGDHTGALPWLYEKGFRGVVIAAGETLRQLPFPLRECLALEDVCPQGTGVYQNLSIQWGRSGHCAGSVWYHFAERDQSILFSGDYTEDTQVYACDPIRRRHADLAVLDCAYGLDETTYEAACNRLVQETERLLSAHSLLLFPVPKYGRGLEIAKLFSDRLPQVPCCGDALFLQNLEEQRAGGFWYLPGKINAPILPYQGQNRGVVFVSDPQLRSSGARRTADRVLSLKGRGVMTGTVEKDSYSEHLLQQGSMVQLRYPVHLHHGQFEQLKARNDFQQVIPYHAKDFPSKQEILPYLTTMKLR